MSATIFESWEANGVAVTDAPHDKDESKARIGKT